MNYVGIDLHKKSITLCVVNKARKTLARRALPCDQPQAIAEWLAAFRPYVAVMEATANYEWLWRVLEPSAEKLVLCHPGKMRVIAESVKKTDKLDAQVLAEFLAMDMIPPAYRPTPRQREHRGLVRQRVRLQQRRTSVKCRIRYLLSDYNADRPDLFTREGLKALGAIRKQLPAEEQFILGQLLREYRCLSRMLADAQKELAAFAKGAALKERQARALLETIPGVGTVVADAVLAELGDVDRFGSQKKVCAYAGLAPSRRESAGKGKELPITKQGSRILRWALVEAAWQLVRHDRRWKWIFEGLAKRRGRKRAIIAVARRLLAMMLAILKTGRPYCIGEAVKAAAAKTAPAEPPAGQEPRAKAARKAAESAASRQRRRHAARANRAQFLPVGPDTEF